MAATVVKKKKQQAEAAKRNAALAFAEEAAPAPATLVEEEEPPPRSNNPLVRCVCFLVDDVINSMALQTALYLAFVVLFQLITASLRKRDEFYLDKHFMDKIVENTFDSAHNTFASIRRTADIWEWGNTVLWPGLFGDNGPCTGTPGSNIHPKSCVDEVWPDGDGSFHLEGATHYEIKALVENMDNVDWTEGIVFKQARVGPSSDCTTHQLGECYPDLKPGTYSTASFGYNWTHPNMPLSQPYTYFTKEQLGASPGGVSSANFASLNNYDSSGFVAIVIPFFSEVYLPLEEGEAKGWDASSGDAMGDSASGESLQSPTVTDYRKYYVNTTNGKSANYYCVRLSPNGRHIKQLCDPGTNGNGTGALTGAVREAVELMWGDMKRGHWIDMQTRVVTLTFQLKSNNVGIRMRYQLMWELTPLGAVFTSFDVESRLLDEATISNLALYSHMALGLVIFFSLMEGIEVIKGGLGGYVNDVWNVMDWANFILYYLVWWRIQTVYEYLDEQPHVTPCTNYFCTEVGYFDDWKVMSAYRQTKLFLSLCVCIQLLKILKFASMLVPKMGLATDVLRKCALDLVFFGAVFVIAMCAFSMMLYIQLGKPQASARTRTQASKQMALHLSSDATFLSDAPSLPTSLPLSTHRPCHGGLHGSDPRNHLALTRALWRL